MSRVASHGERAYGSGGREECHMAGRAARRNCASATARVGRAALSAACAGRSAKSVRLLQVASRLPAALAPQPARHDPGLRQSAVIPNGHPTPGPRSVRTGGEGTGAVARTLRRAPARPARVDRVGVDGSGGSGGHNARTLSNNLGFFAVSSGAPQRPQPGPVHRATACSSLNTTTLVSAHSTPHVARDAAPTQAEKGQTVRTRPRHALGE